MSVTINNEATTTYTQSGNESTASSNINSIILETDSGLTLTKTANPSTFSVGEIIAYSVRITNSSSSYLSGVRIIDDLGGNRLAYVVGTGLLNTGSQTYAVTPVATNPLTFTLQQLAPGETMTLTYRAQVIFNLPSDVDSITNTVRGIGYTSSSTITGSTSSTITRQSGSGVSISKSASVTTVNPNQNFNYYLTVRNNGTVSAEISNITDQLPSNFVLSSITASVNGGSPTTLDSSDYTLSGSKLLTITQINGSSITLIGGQNIVFTLTGVLT